MRGSRLGQHGDDRLAGSIPADAGEPASTSAPSATRRVDPRGCGGAASWSEYDVPMMGRSPRMRGSRDRRRLKARDHGSIPADAGEPRRLARWRLWQGVDPRGCGGAGRDRAASPRRVGRSPRMRGSRKRPGDGARGRGSIPADAGEPGYTPGIPLSARVDPRGCGGAEATIWTAALITGRSPRMRGSLAKRGTHPHLCGSIPADAGEPC